MNRITRKILTYALVIPAALAAYGAVLAAGFVAGLYLAYRLAIV